jgi:hypothetical protein
MVTPQKQELMDLARRQNEVLKNLNLVEDRRRDDRSFLDFIVDPAKATLSGAGRVLEAIEEYPGATLTTVYPDIVRDIFSGDIGQMAKGVMSLNPFTMMGSGIGATLAATGVPGTESDKFRSLLNIPTEEQLQRHRDLPWWIEKPAEILPSLLLPGAGQVKGALTGVRAAHGGLRGAAAGLAAKGLAPVAAVEAIPGRVLGAAAGPITRGIMAPPQVAYAAPGRLRSFPEPSGPLPPHLAARAGRPVPPPIGSPAREAALRGPQPRSSLIDPTGERYIEPGIITLPDGRKFDVYRQEWIVDPIQTDPPPLLGGRQQLLERQYPGGRTREPAPLPPDWQRISAQAPREPLPALERFGSGRSPVSDVHRLERDLADIDDTIRATILAPTHIPARGGTRTYDEIIATDPRLIKGQFRGYKTTSNPFGNLYDAYSAKKAELTEARNVVLRESVGPDWPIGEDPASVARTNIQRWLGPVASPEISPTELGQEIPIPAVPGAAAAAPGPADIPVGPAAVGPVAPAPAAAAVGPVAPAPPAPPAPPSPAGPGIGGGGKFPPITNEGPPIPPDISPPPFPGEIGGVGQPLVGDIRPITDVVQDVAVQTNDVLRRVGGTAINPSLLRTTQVGHLVTAHGMQRVSIDQHIKATLSAAYDYHFTMQPGPRFPGLGSLRAQIGRSPLPINQAGYYGNTGQAWHTIFENPDDLRWAHLIPAGSPERAMIDDFRQVYAEANSKLTEYGLDPIGHSEIVRIARIVKGKGGIEFRRTSNPRMQRLYDDIEDGMAAGVDYELDPRAAMEAHLRWTYREILNHQFDDAIQPFYLKPTDLVPKGLRDAREAALVARTRARAEVNRLRVPKAGRRDRTHFGPDSPEAKKYRADLTPERRAALDNMKKTRDDFREIDDKYQSSMEQARNAQVADSQLYGHLQTNERIGLQSWRNKFFTREDGDVLMEYFSSNAFEPSGFNKGLMTTGNTVRFLASVGDFAMPLRNGLTVLSDNPVNWGRMTANHYRAFFDPSVQAKLIRDNLSDFQEMASYGIPIGDPEFFAALAPGQGPSIEALAKLVPAGQQPMAQQARNIMRAGGRQVFGRFQSAYEFGLTTGRLYTWKGIRDDFKGTRAEAAQYVRNITGGLDSRALGVGPGQRAAEGMWLAFSPRLLRSLIGLVGMAMKPHTPQGRLAIKNLTTLMAGVASIYTVSGLALGKSWEDIQEGFNPTSGRKFLSHEINGDWIGVGGLFRSLIQAIGTTITKPEDLATLNIQQNPWIHLYASRGAPALQIMGGLGEAVLPGQPDILPYEQIDGGVDFLKHTATSALPFTIQGYLEGAGPAAVAGDLIGLRGSPNMRDKQSNRLFGQIYSDLPGYQKAMVRATTPNFNKDLHEANIEEMQALMTLATDWESVKGFSPFTGSSERFRVQNTYSSIRSKYRGIREYIHKDTEFDTKDDLGSSDLEKKAVAEYWNIFKEPGVETATGSINWSVFDHYHRLLQNSWSDEQREAVLRDTNTRPIPYQLLGVLSEQQREAYQASHMARERDLRKRGQEHLIPMMFRISFMYPDIPDEMISR